jgi:hypothetical protein
MIMPMNKDLPVDHDLDTIYPVDPWEGIEAEPA